MNIKYYDFSLMSNTIKSDILLDSLKLYMLSHIK